MINIVAELGLLSRLQLILSTTSLLTMYLAPTQICLSISILATLPHCGRMGDSDSFVDQKFEA